MAVTRLTLKANVRTNLNDAGITFYSAQDLNDSLQDAYDDIAVQSHCILKSTTVSWVSGLVYYDLKTLGVTDYLATVAILNLNNNLWLEDYFTRNQLDAIDPHWEITEGEPRMWMPVNSKYIAVYPRKTTATGTFTLKYWATAPTMTLDTDVVLVATDMTSLFEDYATADLLEQAEEYKKALIWWESYIKDLEDYKERIQNLSKADLLRLI